MTISNRYQNLFDVIEEIHPKTIIEIGTWNGVHAAQMLHCAKEYHVGLDIHYYGFDLWEDFKEKELENCPKIPATLKVAQKNIASTLCNFTLVKGNTRETLVDFPIILAVDLIFIDGGHSLETVMSDWINIQKFITEKTVLLFDDYYPNNDQKGCKRLIDTLICNRTWDIRLLRPIDEFLETNTIVQMVRVQKNE